MAFSSPRPSALISVADTHYGNRLFRTLESRYQVLRAPEHSRVLEILHTETPPPGGSLIGNTPDHPIDIVILDNSASEGALDVLAQIKESPSLRMIPVIIVSGNDSSCTAELGALKQGAADFWTLPIADQVLLARVAVHTRRTRVTRSLARMSMTDLATGAASRRLFEDSLKREWGRAGRENVWLSLAFIAMDGYETYAERLGGESAGECMFMLSEALLTCLRRPGDLISRFSDDIFAALLPSTDNLGAAHVSRQMHASIEGLQLAFPGSVTRLPLAEYVSISMGMTSVVPVAGNGCEAFAESAYNALGEAMAQGPGTTNIQPPYPEALN